MIAVYVLIALGIASVLRSRIAPYGRIVPFSKGHFARGGVLLLCALVLYCALFLPSEAARVPGGFHFGLR